jgi:hypothetical protein
MLMVGKVMDRNARKPLDTRPSGYDERRHHKMARKGRAHYAITPLRHHLDAAQMEAAALAAVSDSISRPMCRKSCGNCLRRELFPPTGLRRITRNIICWAETLLGHCIRMTTANRSSA